jgi:hypothetical protein
VQKEQDLLRQIEDEDKGKKKFFGAYPCPSCFTSLPVSYQTKRRNNRA